MLTFICFITLNLFGQNKSTKPEDPFTVESYYKTRWGKADEFIGLYKKNHYPLLKRALEHGDILKITAESPRLHASEDSRWDFRVTIVFKNIQAAYDENLLLPYKKELFPDIDKLTKEEQLRFELLIAHWDITPSIVNLDN
jgi:hypothetical protein